MSCGLLQVKGILFGPIYNNLYISNTAGGGGVAGPHEVLRFEGPLGTGFSEMPLPAPGQTSCGLCQ